MPEVRSYLVNKYWIYHYNVEYSPYSAVIMLYRPRPHHASPCAFLQFYRNGAPIPASESNTDGQLRLSYHENQLANVIETLRKDKPLRIQYYPSTHRGFLSTMREPIGEEELEQRSFLWLKEMEGYTLIAKNLLTSNSSSHIMRLPTDSSTLK